MTNTDSEYLSSIFRSSFKYQTTNHQYLYESDGFVRRIIDTYPQAAYSTGFTVNSDSGEIYHSALNNLRMWECFKLASIWSRLHGLAVILIGSRGELDQQNTSDEIAFLKVYSLWQGTDISEELITVGNTKVHKSRLLFFKGHESYSDNGEVVVTYRSILDSVGNVLPKFLELPTTLKTLLDTSNQITLGSNGLSAAIRQDILSKTNTQREIIKSRLNSINEGRSLHNTLLYDKESEIVGNTSLSLSGVSDVVAAIESQLCLRLDYPKHILFGESSSGTNLGSGQVAQLVERMVWATKISEWIENNWLENVELLCNRLRNNLKLSDFTISIPLSLILSPAEIAQINLQWADILAKIAAVYPMTDVLTLKEFIERHFHSVVMPDPPAVQPIPAPVTAEASTTDSITDELNDLLRIDADVINEVMRKIT